MKSMRSGTRMLKGIKKKNRVIPTVCIPDIYCVLSFDDNIFYVCSECISSDKLKKNIYKVQCLFEMKLSAI